MAGPPSWGLAVHVMAFEDLDGNGRRTRNEPFIPGVAIYNTSYSDEGYYAGGTGDDGRWSTFSAGGGHVSLRAVPPDGMHFSPGEDGIRSATYRGGGGHTNVRKVKPLALTRTAGISGTLFFDRDADGVRSADAVGLRGHTVVLDSNRDGFIGRGDRQTRTGDNGGFAFGGLAPGTYWVKVVEPRNWFVSTPAGSFVMVVVPEATVADVLVGFLWDGDGTPRL